MKKLSRFGLVFAGSMAVCAMFAQSNPSAKKTVDMAYADKVAATNQQVIILKAVEFPSAGTSFYVDRKKWLAINPDKNKDAEVSMRYDKEEGVFDLLLLAVGENDGKSEFKVSVNNVEIMNYYSPISSDMFEEGPQYNDLRENIQLKKGDIIKVQAKVGSNDGQEFSRGRWAGLALVPVTKGKDVLEQLRHPSAAAKKPVKFTEPVLHFSDINSRKPNGNGQVAIEGELKQWHKVTLTLNGPFAHELDKAPNPFTDYRMMVRFRHESGSPSYTIPAYFAADGNAGQTSADNGTKWRAHLSPDKAGKWTYTVQFVKGTDIAVNDNEKGEAVKPFDGKTGSFTIGATDKKGADLRSKGRLEYVGKHHLQFQGNKQYFMKVGADAPETLLGYEDFDATYTMKVPLKKFEPHLKDFNAGDPTWKNGKGKGLIGAVNYLAGKGLNAFSFLTYNAAGDGDNVWPFVKRNEKMHYDCSKLDQWGIVFDHAEKKGMFLHFKTQETENDDNIIGKDKMVDLPEALDGGDLGRERKLYYRELIARYSYLLALNWNLGEENTQSTKQRQDMAAYFRDHDPYKQSIVLHTYPDQQESAYPPLLGQNSALTGVSLQNHWNNVHERTLRWLKASNEAGRPWIVANDEQGSAGQGVPPDPGYRGYDAQKIGYDLHDVRKQTLWGNIMAGGAGVEYYFGYSLPENDLVMEDYRSRDQSWDYCRVAVNFLKSNAIPFWDMKNRDELIDNKQGGKEKFCFAKEGQLYLVYLAYVPTSTLDLTKASGSFKVQWYNPRKGGSMQNGSVTQVKAGSVVQLGNPPTEAGEDWLAVVQKM